MIGSATPPFGSYLTRLQSSRSRIRPAPLLPSAGTLRLPEGSRRSAQPGEFRHRTGACYAAPRQAYRGGTHTRKSGTASPLPSGSFVQDATCEQYVRAEWAQNNGSIGAAGIEPASMFKRKSDGTRRPLPGLDSPPNPLPLRVPWSPLQSPGVLPSPGDMLETAPTRGFLFR